MPGGAEVGCGPGQPELVGGNQQGLELHHLWGHLKPFCDSKNQLSIGSAHPWALLSAPQLTHLTHSNSRQLTWKSPALQATPQKLIK